MRIDEIRSNPDKNPKLSIIDVLEKYSTSDDVYVTFTELNKLGINPRSDFSDTPMGIYAYPVKQIWDKYIAPKKDDLTDLSKVIPYAAWRPYATIFRCRSQPGMISSLSSYTNNDLEADVDKLKPIMKAIDHRMGDAMVDEYYRKSNTQSDNTTAFGGLWYITNHLAGHAASRNPAQEGRYTSNYFSIVWNAIFRQMGYVGFSDTEGLGIIHKNEPVQALFLSTKPLEIIGTFDNRTYRNAKNSDISNEGKLASWVKKRFGPEIDDPEFITNLTQFATRIGSPDLRRLVLAIISKAAKETQLSPEDVQSFFIGKNNMGWNWNASFHYAVKQATGGGG